MLKDVGEVLSPLADATEMLTTESTPAAGAMYYLLHELVNYYLAVVSKPTTETTGVGDDDGVGAGEDSDSTEEDIEVDAPAEEYDSTLAAKLKLCISGKLQERFCVDEAGQPEMAVCRTCPLMIAAFCDPR